MRRTVAPDCLHRRFAALSGTDAHGGFHWRDVDFAISAQARVRRLGNHGNYFVDQCVAAKDLQPHAWHVLYQVVDNALRRAPGSATAKAPHISDNLRRYRAIRGALRQCHPGEPTGNVARHLTTLAALISGIVASKSTQLPNIATHVPDGNKVESRVKRFSRWIDNDHILEEVYFLPYADLLLSHLALQTLVLIMDGSVAGRGCMALMIHVVYKGRALPPTNGRRRRLVVCVPDGLPHDGVVGRRDLSSRHLGGV